MRRLPSWCTMYMCMHIANFVHKEHFLLSCTGGESEISPISPKLLCSRVWYFMFATTVLFFWADYPQSSWQPHILSKCWRRNFPVWLRLTRLIRFVESPMQNVSWCRVFLKKVLGKHLWIGRIDAVVNKWIKHVKNMYINACNFHLKIIVFIFYCIILLLFATYA